MSQAKQTNQRVAILWTSGTAGSSDFLQDCAAARPGDTFLLADVTAGKDNRQLAASLKVKHFPTVQARFDDPVSIPSIKFLRNSA